MSVSCRDIDTASRFGGDEFALILPETGAEPGKIVARRICSALAADGRDPELSVSVGAAIYPHDGQTIESLLSSADAALYAMKAKRTASDPTSDSSKNRVAPCEAAVSTNEILDNVPKSASELIITGRKHNGQE
jgi:diguanylate cyclase